MHDEHPSAVEGVLIRNGMRWRDIGPVYRWDDVIAVLECEPYDSPISKVLHPDTWFWHDPSFIVLNEVRNHLRQMNYKTPVDKDHASKVPPPSRSPWEVDESVEKVAPEPSTQDDIDAHLARLNGKA